MSKMDRLIREHIINRFILLQETLLEKITTIGKEEAIKKFNEICLVLSDATTEYDPNCNDEKHLTVDADELTPEEILDVYDILFYYDSEEQTSRVMALYNGAVMFGCDWMMEKLQEYPSCNSLATYLIDIGGLMKYIRYISSQSLEIYLSSGISVGVDEALETLINECSIYNTALNLEKAKLILKYYEIGTMDYVGPKGNNKFNDYHVTTETAIRKAV